MPLIRNGLCHRRSNPMKEITEDTVPRSSLPLNVRYRPEIGVKLAVESKIKQADVVEYETTASISHDTPSLYTRENTTKSRVVDQMF